MKINSKSLLRMDCPTRWNLTYIVLENAIKFSSMFARMEELDTEYQKSFKDKKLIGPPTAKSFKEAQEFVAFLKVFYNVTLKFSGSLHMISNLAFQQIINVAVLLKRRANNPNSLLCHMAKSMQGKYDKYWGKFENLNPLLVIAVVLNLRYKMKFLKFAFEDMFSDPTHRDAMSKKVSAVLYRLYDHYSNVHDASQLETQTASQSQSQSQLSTQGSCGTDVLELESFDIDDREGSCAIQRFLAHTDFESQTNKYVELERYLQAELANCHNPTFDLLDWWIMNASKYKVISLIARDVLVMPISTVSSESTFSTGGFVIDDFRSSLSSKIVEALICAQNWLSPSTFKLKNFDIDNFNETLATENDEAVTSVGEVEELKK